MSALSAAAWARHSIDEIIEASSILSRFHHFLWCYAGELWHGGYDLAATGKHPHYSLLLPGPLTDDTWEDLAQIFRPL